MKIEEIIQGLEKNLLVFQALFSLHSQELIHFKPSEKSWCFLEIACHLVDEEVEDFRARVSHMLSSPKDPFMSISPTTWPIERDYLNQDYQEVVNRFIQEREHSVEWLKQLNYSNWSNSINHPVLGEISAHSFLVNWLAHDYQHIRQLNALKHAYLKSMSGNDLAYAGKW